MDAGVATVLVALIGLVSTIVTGIMSKKNKAIAQKVEKQNIFITKEKGIRQKLNQKEKEREETLHEVMLLILDTNLSILKATQNEDLVDDKVFKDAEELKKKFNDISESMDDIYKEYELILEMTKDFQDEVERRNSN